MDEDSLEAVAGLIGEVSFHQDDWPKLLDRLSSVSRCRGVAIIPIANGGRGVRHTDSLAPLLDRYIESGWAECDFRMRGMPRMMSGQVTVDAHFVDYDDMKREPYYTSFLAPLGFRHFAGFAVGGENDAFAVTLQRGLDDDAFSATEQAALACLIRPFALAAKVGAALGESYRRGTLDRLDASGTGCILVDRLGRAVHLNRAAEEMVGRVFDVRRGVVLFEDQRDTRALQAHLRVALDPRAPLPPPLLATAQGARIICEVCRLPNLDRIAFAGFRGMILVRELRRPAPDLSMLRSLFDLTTREAQLAEALCRSSGLVGAADALGIKYETARTHLKALFAKTGAISQADLVALLSRLEPNAPPH